jgi:tetratricopeptide (TPR) repeat protein
MPISLWLLAAPAWSEDEQLTASKVLRRAAEVARSIEPAGVRAIMLGRIGEALVEAGDREAAEQVSRQIVAISDSPSAFASVAAKLGDFEAAKGAAERIDRKYTPAKIELLGDIAKAQVKTGRKADACATLRAAIPLAQALPTLTKFRSEEMAKQHRAGHLFEIAGWLAQAGDARRAVELADSVADDELERRYKVEGLCQLAAALAESGEREAAVTTVRKAAKALGAIDSQSAAATDARNELVRVQAELGLVDEAIRTAGTIELVIGRNQALAEIARVRLLKKDWEGSLRVARDIDTAFLKAGALIAVARQRLEAGDRVASMTLLAEAKRVAKGTEHNEFLKNVAELQVRFGDLDAAFETASLLPFPEERADALRIMAQTQDRLGDKRGAARTLDQALKLVDEIVLKGHWLTGTRVIGDLAAAKGRIDGSAAAAPLFAQAVRKAETIQRPSERWAVLRDLAGVQYAAGDRSGARATANHAVQARQTVEEKPPVAASDYSPRAVDLGMIARIQAAAGDPEGASAWAERLAVAQEKTQVLLSVASGLMERAKAKAPQPEASRR